MLGKLSVRKTMLLALGGLAALALITTVTTVPNAAAEFSGREILSVTRIAHGGADYAGLQNVTVQVVSSMPRHSAGWPRIPSERWPRSN